MGTSMFFEKLFLVFEHLFEFTVGEIAGNRGSPYEYFNSSLLKEKGGGMLKKFLFLLCVPILGLLLLTAKPADAATSVSANIVLRATVTISVSLVTPNTWYTFGEVSAASTNYSNTPIVVRNDSLGAICRWDLNIDPTSLAGWTLGSAPGLDQVALFARFRKTDQPTDAMFVASSTLSATAKEYNAINFYDSDYDTDGHLNDASKILPQAYAITVGKSADRRLWLKLQTPTLVTDQNWRTLRLVVTAKMAG